MNLDSSRYQVFDCEKLFRYNTTYGEFGPLNLSQIWRFCTGLERKLREAKFTGTKLLSIGSPEPLTFTNGIFLLSMYL